MAVKYDDQSEYQGKLAPATTEYPYGEPRNITTSGDGTGTPWRALGIKDTWGFLAKLLKVGGGITPSNNPDNAVTSQYFEGLANARWDEDTPYHAGTVVTASDGNQYKAVVNSTGVDPTGVADRTQWVQYPYEERSNVNGEYKIYHDGAIEQWGVTANTDGTGSVIVTLPLEMPSADYHVYFTDRTTSASTPSAIAKFGFVFDVSTTTTFRAIAALPDGSPAANDSAEFYVKSK